MQYFLDFYLFDKINVLQSGKLATAYEHDNHDLISLRTRLPLCIHQRLVRKNPPIGLLYFPKRINSIG